MPDKTYPIAILLRNHVFTMASPGHPPIVNGRHQLGEYLHGRLTADSARKIAGENFARALGAVLHAPDGAEFYQIEDAMRDIRNILDAHGLKECRLPEVATLGINERATVIDLALECLDANCAPEPSFLEDAIQYADHALLERVLPGIKRELAKLQETEETGEPPPTIASSTQETHPHSELIPQ